MGTNLTESKPHAQLEVYISMEERRKVSNFAGKSSTSGTTRLVIDEHIFQLNSSYCKLYWDSSKVLLPDETELSHGVKR